MSSRSSVPVDRVRSKVVDRTVEAGKTVHAWLALVYQRAASRPVAAEGIDIAGAARSKAVAVVADIPLARSCAQAIDFGMAAARLARFAVGPEIRYRQQILPFGAGADELLSLASQGSSAAAVASSAVLGACRPACAGQRAGQEALRRPRSVAHHAVT